MLSCQNWEGEWKENRRNSDMRDKLIMLVESTRLKMRLREQKINWIILTVSVVEIIKIWQ